MIGTLIERHKKGEVDAVIAELYPNTNPNHTFIATPMVAVPGQGGYVMQTQTYHNGYMNAGSGFVTSQMPLESGFHPNMVQQPYSQYQPMVNPVYAPVQAMPAPGPYLAPAQGQYLAPAAVPMHHLSTGQPFAPSHNSSFVLNASANSQHLGLVSQSSDNLSNPAKPILSSSQTDPSNTSVQDDAVPTYGDLEEVAPRYSMFANDSAQSKD